MRRSGLSAGLREVCLAVEEGLLVLADATGMLSSACSSFSRCVILFLLPFDFVVCDGPRACSLKPLLVEA